MFLKKCDICGENLVETNISYDDYKQLPKTKRCPKCKRKYPKFFIKCSKCNVQLTKLSTENKNINKQVEEIKKQTQEYQGQQSHVPKCPTCGSTDIEKISTSKKAIGFAAVGVFSSNFGKTMHCKKCGYKW